jgi:general secretion pathway protein D
VNPGLQRATALLAAMLAPSFAVAQQEAPIAAPAPAAAPAAQKSDTPASSSRNRRKAAKLFLEASRQFEKGQFEQSMQTYARAAELAPENRDYALAAEVARSHAVTALIQQAAKARNQQDAAASRAALERARNLDPKNPQVAQHFGELADDLTASQDRGIYDAANENLAGVPRLEPKPGLQSFHLRADRRSMIQRVYQAFGISTAMDQSVQATSLRFDLDGATFAQAVQAIADATDTFAVPLDPHRVVVARNTKQYRDQYQRLESETLYLEGLKADQLTEISNVAKNVFGVNQISTSETKSAMTLRALPATLDAFNTTMSGLLEGKSQVMLDVQIIQVARTRSRGTGVQPPQSITGFNVYAEEQSILSQNQTLVDEIISSGLASADDPLAILGILIAAGAVSSSLFENGVATVGGGLGLTGLTAGNPLEIKLALNSSATRTLDDVRLRLSDGQEQTLRNGIRYPILTASYSGLSSSSTSGLTSAGTSSALSSLLSSSSSSSYTVPQIQYQDLGMTLKVTPKIMRSGEIALSLDLKLTGLTGSSVDSMPVLSNRSYSGVITLQPGYGALLMGYLDEQQSRALSGMPGLSEIPGLDNITSKTADRDYSTLVVVVTPHLLNAPETYGHTPMLRIDRTSVTR